MTHNFHEFSSTSSLCHRQLTFGSVSANDFCQSLLEKCTDVRWRPLLTIADLYNTASVYAQLCLTIAIATHNRCFDVFPQGTIAYIQYCISRKECKLTVKWLLIDRLNNMLHREWPSMDNCHSLVWPAIVVDYTIYHLLCPAMSTDQSMTSLMSLTTSIAADNIYRSVRFSAVYIAAYNIYRYVFFIVHGWNAIR